MSSNPPGEAFHIVNGDADPRIILICDHATAIVPPEYSGLGLEERQFQRHIAWDIGAEDVTAAMAARLQCPAVSSRFSRLVIDPNRGLDDPTLIMRLSDGAVIPGNHPITADERAARIARFYRPYDAAIASQIARAEAMGIDPVLVSIHSFTPVWRGRPRPWHIGILWDGIDTRIAPGLIARLRREPMLITGDNEPYRGGLPGDTMNRHAEVPGRRHVLIEVRQDLVGDRDAAATMAERLARALADVVPEAAEALERDSPQG